MPKTTVNKKVFRIPKSILWTGKGLQFISPYLATSFAYKLFMTPYKFKRPKREQKMYDEFEHEMLLVPVLEKKIKIYKKGDGSKKILLIHGWAGRGTQLTAIADALLSLEFSVYSFDGTAHGDSEGKTSAMPEFIASILAIEKKYGKFEFAIGHSLGAMAMINAVKEGFAIEKMVAIGTADSITKITHQFVSKLGLKPKVSELLKIKLDKNLGRDSEELSAGFAGKSIKIPTLIIHDENDDDVPLQWAKDVHNSIETSEMLITKKLGHRRILFNKEVINSIISFIEK